MDSFLMNPALWAAAFLVVIAAGVLVAVSRRWRERLGDLRRTITLLRASDPRTRVQSLQRAQALGPADRARLGKLLRADLARGAPGGKRSAQQAATVWFIRQILALLADPRRGIRGDAARVLSAVMGRGASQLAQEDGEQISLAPAVAAAVELAGGRVLSESESARSETRVLALAEMLEAGLRPLAVSLRALEGVEDEALEPLSSALRDRSPGVRRTLVEVLSAVGGERAVEMLVPLLQDPNPDLRAQAVHALGSLGATGHSEDVQKLLSDPVGSVRAAAARALAEMEQTASCGSILDALTREAQRQDRSDQAVEAMVQAAVALSEGGLTELSLALTELPRPVAGRLATSLESGGVVERWLSEAEWEGPEDLLARLLSSLADLGVSRPLLEALESPEERVRRHSVAALGHSRDSGSIAAVAALLSDPDAAVRAEAVKAMAQRRQPAALGTLSRAVADPDQKVRVAAVTGLTSVLSAQEHWRPDVLPADFDVRAAMTECQRALLSAHQDPGHELRVQTAKGLALCSTAEAADALARMALEDADQAVREAATEAFAVSRFRQKGRLLAAALEDDDEVRRARALLILSKSAGQQAARQVIEALDDPSETVRNAALEAVGEMDPRGLTDALLPLLKNPDTRVRATAAAQLGEAGANEAADALIRALSDPDEDVRVSALGSVARLGRAVRKHQGAITARRSDPSPRVREAAAAALTQLHGAWSEVAEAGDLFRQGPLSPAAATSLVDMAVTGDVDPLLRSLGAEQSDRVVAEHLAGEGRRKLVALLAALHGLPEQEQTRAAIALAGGLRQGVPAEAFLDALKALESDVRLMAVEIAGQLRTPEAVAALIEALQRDPVADVRSRTASVLADAPGDRPREALQQAHRDDPNNVVRRVAGHALSRGRESEEAVSIFPNEREDQPQADTA